MNWGPSIDQCNDENTKQVDLKQLLSEPETFKGQCVETQGIVSARALFLNKRDANRRHASSNDRNAKRRLGIYAGERRMKTLFDQEGEQISVSGLISDCSELQGENVIMVLGYCHYTGGPIIGLAMD